MSDLELLLSKHRAGHTLAQPFYVDPQVFEIDADRIFRRHWLLAGPSCRIKQAGDYFTCLVANDSIIILRDEIGEVRGFHNVCRHRGSRICLDGNGHTKRLVCPYHNWSYGLDGALCVARHLPDEYDRSTLSLHPVAVCEVAGLIFFCLSNRPPAFDRTAADVAEFLAPHELERTRICRTRTETIRANWKVVAENFWECYHCAPTHPEFCSVMSYAHAANNERLAEERAQFERDWEAATRARGFMTGRVPASKLGLHQGGRIPIRPGYLTQSRDGRPVAPLLGRYREYDGGITSFMHFPIIWYVVANDYAFLTRFTPLGPLATELELTWLVHEDAVDGRDYCADDVAWLWQITAQQDKTICENNQLGILSSRYQPGPYVETESAAREFVEWYLKEVGIDQSSLPADPAAAGSLLPPATDRPYDGPGPSTI
jgi:glycine betaine catabolism A